MYVDLAAKRPDQTFWLRFEKRLAPTPTRDHHRGALHDDGADSESDGG